MNALDQFLENARILVVDDEPANLRLLERQLHDGGWVNVRLTSDSREALPLFQKHRPDIVLLDLLMPHVNGFEVMEQIRAALPINSFVPILVLTADVTQETRNRALQSGARDFLLKPYDKDELFLRVRNLLETRFLHVVMQQHNDHLESRVNARTREYQNAMQELKSAQGQLVNQERLHAFAAMAGGVAHDFNNSLTVMMGYCDVLLDDGGFDDPAEARRSVETIYQATKDAAHMVERLRSFSRPREESDVYTAVRLPEIVKQTVDLAQPKWKNLARSGGSYIVVTTDIPEQLTVRGNSQELREMLMNLLFNAVDAMPRGGHISIRARATTKEVILEVADTGVGMPIEVKNRCLEPFFTTKGEKGTGLGLPMVLGTVRRHEGTLEIHSEPGRGTMFAIRLPREVSEAPKPVKQEPGNLPPLRILFADDDAAIRKVVPMSLTRSGHDVTVACDGSEALSLYEKGKYDLVLTDLSMPKMSGEKLARAIKDISADQPIIILTGYADMLLKSGQKPPFVDLLITKPISSEALSNAIATMIPTITSSRQLRVSAEATA